MYYIKGDGSQIHVFGDDGNSMLPSSDGVSAFDGKRLIGVYYDGRYCIEGDHMQKLYPVSDKEKDGYN